MRVRAVEPLFGEDVHVGTELPPLTVTIGAVQAFLFSAAAYNAHRIHYDRSWATEVEGHPGVVVQGYLQLALLGRAVTDWIQGHGLLLSLSTQNRGSAHVDQQLTFRGTVTAVRPEGDRHVVDLRVRAENVAGEVIMPGTASVSLPSRPDRPRRDPVVFLVGDESS